jgi:uncharacterized protein with PQ loop repeat
MKKEYKKQLSLIALMLMFVNFLFWLFSSISIPGYCNQIIYSGKQVIGIEPLCSYAHGIIVANLLSFIAIIILYYIGSMKIESP